MATPEDSNVLRQLIDQIDGELSTFNDVGGGPSDQSLSSYGASSQGSLAPSETDSSRSGSITSFPRNGQQQQEQPRQKQQEHRQPLTLQQQKQFHVASATSAIFGSSYQKSLQQSGSGVTSLVMNDSYYLGPRAPQYIPSPLPSPISPDSGAVPRILAGVEGHEKEANGAQLKPTSSQGSSLSAVAADPSHEHQLQQQQPQDSLATPTETEVTVTGLEDDKEILHPSGPNGSDKQMEHPYNDDIKVDVTELYENFGQRKPAKATTQEMTAQTVVDYKVETTQVTDKDGHASTVTTVPMQLSKLPELSFSNNDLTSLWTAESGSSPSMNGSNSSQDQDTSDQRPPAPPTLTDAGQDAATDIHVNGGDTASMGMTPAGPPPSDGRSSPQFRDQIRTDKRKGLSLVTTGMGLAAAASAAAASRANLTQQGPETKGFLEFPSWDLAPLSPPVVVIESNIAPTTSTSASTATTPVSAKKGSLGKVLQDSAASNLSPDTACQTQLGDGLMSPASATLMTPTTPLTTREARILAGREALLRMSPDKNRIQRGVSASSTTSSISSTGALSGVSSGDSHHNVDPQDGTRHENVSAEKLVFPDQSLRPIPLKAYRVRKMTLGERNQTYAQACEEFTKARTGLDVWALRCMMQDRPALMKDPPTIVRAATEKCSQGSSYSHTDGSTVSRMTSTTSQSVSSPVASTISNIHGMGIGARLKNASKRLSMDISGTVSGGGGGIHNHPLQATIPENSPQSNGSMFYKQKSTRSAVELGSWSSGRVRGLSNGSNHAGSTVNIGTFSPSQASGSHRHSISGQGVASSSIGAPLGGTSVAGSPSPSGSRFLIHNKRNSIAVGNSSPLANTLRNRTLSDVQTNNRLSFMGRDSLINRSTLQQQRSEAISDIPSKSGGPLSPTLSSSFTGTGTMPTTTSSGFMERPAKRSLSSHYTRRPASMMIVPTQTGANSSMNPSGSNPSLGSVSSLSLHSTRSQSSNSMTESEHRSLPTTSSLTTGQMQQQSLQGQSLQREVSAASTNSNNMDGHATMPAQVFNADGTPIPYADETKSKDEVYSPLTSPIMIPAGGFPPFKPNPTYQSHGGWSSPHSAGGGLTRPLTYAGPSSSTPSSNSSLIMSPSSINKDYSQSHVYKQESNVSSLTMEPVKEKPEKSNRYSTSSFSSLGSFAKYQKRDSQKRLSKKERKKEQQQQQQQQEGQGNLGPPLDQRYSVSSASVNQSPAHANDYLTEQSLDKLSDVLPHVDRDRLAIYLQRAYGDEMVAIGLAMSDLRQGNL
ncbi:hypothetical protein BG011_006401 [Mortierella polycephala]|uniref:Uncharacterized protein n=1 Tax=Mortierella polycephala TaxID=41804 RepID=A0A9P6PVH2_9FUNG|nr:hypothetical protein BG011_006401 [Mortierella polycephala]